MGFSFSKAQSALSRCDQDMDKAIAILMDSNDDPAPSTKSNINKAVEDAENLKKQFALNAENGLLMGLIDYIKYRLLSLNKYVFDRKRVFSNRSAKVPY